MYTCTYIVSTVLHGFSLSSYSGSTVHPQLSKSQLSERLTCKLVTAHVQLVNFKMAAIIFVGVFTTLLWLIHCGAKEKERCIIGRV